MTGSPAPGPNRYRVSAKLNTDGYDPDAMNRILHLLPGLLAIALLGAPLAGSAKAQSTEASEIRTLLETRDKEIKGLLADGSLDASRREHLKNVINGIIDFEALGKSALGTHWSNLTDVQRAEFSEVFAEIVRRQSISDLDVYRAKVAYGHIDVDGSTAKVSTTATIKDKPTPIVYEMHAAAGEWRIIDIVIDDVSTAEGYARSFQSLIRKRGFDTLMEKLRARRDA